jgi:succinate dehydrogenase hydrophobic anchor subunit
VIEDYVHSPKWLITSILLNKFIFAIAAIAGVLAVLKISLGAMGN